MNGMSCDLRRTARIVRVHGGRLARWPARYSRPTRRTVYLSFDPSLIRRPQKLRFAGETVWRGEKCPHAAGCADLAPDAPKTVTLKLREAAQ